jgi:hypothetical protein
VARPLQHQFDSELNFTNERWSASNLTGLEFYRGHCRRGRTKCCGSLRQRRQFFAVECNFYTIHCASLLWYLNSDVDQIMRKSRKKTLKKYVDMFLACQKSKVTIKLKFYYSNLKNAVETAKIAVDSCYVLRQFLTQLPSIDFREIRGLESNEEVLVDIRIILRGLRLSNVSSESLYYFHSFSTQNRISPEKYHTVECRVQRGKRVWPQMK